MREEKPCCPSSAARKVRQLTIQGRPVGIAQLDEIMAEASALGLEKEEDLSKELLRRAEVFNYIPPKMSSDYGSALLEEYRRRHGKSP
jgi:hypothetical protein